MPEDDVRTVTRIVVPQVPTGQEIDGVVPVVERLANPACAPLAIESREAGMVMLWAFTVLARDNRSVINATALKLIVRKEYFSVAITTPACSSKDFKI